MFKNIIVVAALAFAALFATTNASACGGYGAPEDMIQMQISWAEDSQSYAMQQFTEAIAAGDKEAATQAMQSALEANERIELLRSELAVFEAEKAEVSASLVEFSATPSN